MKKNISFALFILSAFLGLSAAVVHQVIVPYNIKSYGANGNDALSDSVAIQAALDTGQNILCPPGTYYLTTGVTASTEGQRIFGMGQGLTIFKSTMTINMVTISARFIHLSDLTLDGGGVATRGILVTTPKPYIHNLTVTHSSVTAIELQSFTNFIYGNNIFENYGHGLKLATGGTNNDTHINNNVISGNGKNGIWITAGSPSFTDGVFISGNSMENNCSSGTATTVYAHINIEGGSRNIKLNENYHESDVSQTGFNKQLFVFIGQGSQGISINNSYMSSGGGTQFEYYVEVGTSSYPVQIENSSMVNASSAAVRDFSGASGRVFSSMNLTTTNQPSPAVDWPGLKIASNAVTMSDFPGVIISSYTVDLFSAGGAAADLRLGAISSNTVTQVQGRDGTVGYPFYAFANSPQTGLYRPGTNSLGFSTGGSSATVITASQEVLQWKQPNFLAGALSNANVTGNGTTVTVPFTTEVFDQSGALSNSTFTAAVGGRYFFCTAVRLQGIDSSHTGAGVLGLVTSNRTYELDYVGVSSMSATGGFLKMNGCTFADMDTADTAYVTIVVSGGTQTVEVFNDVNANIFSGDLSH